MAKSMKKPTLFFFLIFGAILNFMIVNSQPGAPFSDGYIEPAIKKGINFLYLKHCLLYTSPSPRD